MCSGNDEAFTCPRHAGGLRLTPAACAAMWRRGKAADPLDSIALCQGCAIGAGHAGEPMAAPAPSVPPKVCVRCGAVCGLAGPRLVPSRGVCVSCYNREREIARGADRRGKVPRKPAQVAALRVDADGAMVHRQAAGRVELTLWALRAGAQAVSRHVPRGSPLQMSLWPGC